ncbi:FadR/GntR family transcriptional regulator [Shinella granuli]|jgi:GntR family transcriptional repressor for pyruvate dehydrogenase complex|uniref:DNA-binding FadR family transcriptional regulator n=1 Tax=Shinella granuli TaxID=323621 RepID=A0A4R2BV28_SHIGR|nr:FadR/GntR family transcriptional regulator [Shinella granuli]TCN30702.1 DNA-binding FadR family transcriptional regulator [Shinella granuli]
MEQNISSSDLKYLRRSDFIYDQLVGEIVSGAMQIGDRFETETQLAARFEVSRPIIREALARLREDGVIASRQGSGTYLSRRPEAKVSQIAPLASVNDIQRCFEMRISVEGDSAYFAALRAEKDDIDTIARCCDALERVNLDANLGGEEDFLFHRAVALASKNRFYVSIIDQIREHLLQGILINRALKMDGGQSRISKVVVDHAAILECIRKGDAEGAKASMKTHLLNAKSRIFEG